MKSNLRLLRLGRHVVTVGPTAILLLHQVAVGVQLIHLRILLMFLLHTCRGHFRCLVAPIEVPTHILGHSLDNAFFSLQRLQEIAECDLEILESFRGQLDDLVVGL